MKQSAVAAVRDTGTVQLRRPSRSRPLHETCNGWKKWRRYSLRNRASAGTRMSGRGCACFRLTMRSHTWRIRWDTLLCSLAVHQHWSPRKE